MLTQKAPWILDGEVPRVEGFERDIGVVRKGALAQSRLPRLARSRHSHHGHLFGERHQGWAEVSEDHAQIVNRIDNLRNILGCTYGQSRHFLNLVFLPRKGIFKGMDIISCLRYI